jgi:hypothetical protein
LQVPLERVESRGPFRSIRLEPRVELHQRFGTESVEPPLSVTPDLHQPGVTQHLEVARHPRLVHPYLVDQLADRPLTVADGIEDPSSCRLRDHLEDREL